MDHSAIDADVVVAHAQSGGHWAYCCQGMLLDGVLLTATLLAGNKPVLENVTVTEARKRKGE